MKGTLSLFTAIVALAMPVQAQPQTRTELPAGRVCVIFDPEIMQDAARVVQEQMANLGCQPGQSIIRVMTWRIPDVVFAPMVCDFRQQILIFRDTRSGNRNELVCAYIGIRELRMGPPR